MKRRYCLGKVSGELRSFLFDLLYRQFREVVVKYICGLFLCGVEFDSFVRFTKCCKTIFLDRRRSVYVRNHLVKRIGGNTCWIFDSTNLEN